MKTTTFFLSLTMLLWGSLTFGQWTQTGDNFNGSTAGDRFGTSVSVSPDGSWLAVGAPYRDSNGANAGQVTLYQWQAGGWIPLEQFNGAAADDQFGYSLSFSANGTRLAVGVPLSNGGGTDSGQVQVLEYAAGSWNQLGANINGIAREESGFSVSLSADGNRIAIGAIFNDGLTGDLNDNRGAVRIYQWDGASWQSLGAAINGNSGGDRSGYSVSLSADGNRVAIGSPYNGDGGAQAGHVRMYELQGNNWNPMGTPIVGVVGSTFGWAVSLSADGSRVVVGAPLFDGNGVDAGRVRGYQWDGDSWEFLGGVIDGIAANEQAGAAVCLSADGDRVVLGAPYNSVSGVVRLYQLRENAWVKMGEDGDTRGDVAGDQFGISVSLSPDGQWLGVGGNYYNVQTGYARVYGYSVPDVVIGEGAGGGTGNSAGEGNMFLGYYSGFNCTTGSNNTFVGRESGYSNTSGSGNVFLGYRAGYDETTGNDHLFIDNSDTSDPLIWGDFAADALRVNGSLRVTNLPQDDALTRVLVADATGNLNWREAATLNTDSQTLSVSSTGTTRTLDISGGNAVELDVADNDNDAANEIQDITFTNGIISLSSDPGATQINLSAYDSNAADDFNGSFTSLTNVPAGLADGDTVRSDEEIQDVTGAMVSGNTETRIAVTYDDPTGKLNFEVTGNLSEYTNDAGFATTTGVAATYAPKNSPVFTGNVGIGTTNPAEARLHIHNATALGGNINDEFLFGRFSQSTGNNKLDIKYRRHTAGADWMGTHTRIQKTVDVTSHGFIDFGINGRLGDAGLGFGSGSNTHMVVENGGNVGIGTTIPQASLHVTGTTADSTPNTAGTQIRDGIIELTRNGSQPFIDFQDDISGTDYDARIILTANDALSIYGANLNMQDSELQYVRALQLRDWDDDTGGEDEKYRLLARDGAFQFYDGGVVVGNYNNGTWADLADGRLIVEDRVGIGTADPQDKLHLYGSGTTTLRLQSSSGFGAASIEFWSDPQGSANEWRPAYIQSTDNGSFTGGLAFFTNGTGSGNKTGSVETMRLVNGEVGIGTTSPSEKLHVNGSIAFGTTGSVIKPDQGGSIELRSNIGNNTHTPYIDFTNDSNTDYDARLVLAANNVLTVHGAELHVYNDYDSEGYTFYTNGNVGKPGGASWIVMSDRALKQDISPFTDGLEKIKQIKPVWYRYNGLAGLPTGERYVGIIAQEMQEIAPYTVGKFVYQDSTGVAEEYLDYDGNAVTYMLINAIKEQQQQIEALKSALYGGPNATQSLPTSRETSVTGEPQSLPGGFALYQNVPNPFDKSTVIVAQLPENVQQAKIVVYNLQGLELASYPLGERGKVSVEISGGRFPAGMYLYALLADGQVIDTKKMILTD